MLLLVVLRIAKVRLRIQKKCNILEGPVLALDGLRNVLITNAGLVGLVDFG
jgi:hypothetical protein